MTGLTYTQNLLLEAGGVLLAAFIFSLLTKYNKLPKRILHPVIMTLSKIASYGILNEDEMSSLITALISGLANL